MSTPHEILPTALTTDRVRFYVPVDTTQVISGKLFAAASLLRR